MAHLSSLCGTAGARYEDGGGSGGAAVGAVDCGASSGADVAGASDGCGFKVDRAVRSSLIMSYRTSSSIVTDGDT